MCYFRKEGCCKQMVPRGCKHVYKEMSHLTWSIHSVRILGIPLSTTRYYIFGQCILQTTAEHTKSLVQGDSQLKTLKLWISRSILYLIFLLIFILIFREVSKLQPSECRLNKPNSQSEAGNFARSQWENSQWFEHD